MRLPRLSVANVPQHVIVRGNNSEAIFKSQHDCKSYLFFLQQAAEKYSTSVHSYVLMANHVHLLISSQHDKGVSRTIQALARHYVPYFNHRYSRSGALFNARYRSALIENGDAVLSVYRYIEENPVRAGMCEQPQDYRWSSYKTNAYGEANSLVSASREYLALAGNVDGRCERYRKLSIAPIDPEQLSFIRKQTNRSLIIGSDLFRKRMEKHFGVCLHEKPRGGDRRSQTFRRNHLATATV